MANPVGILIGAAGLIVSTFGGLALGQYAVSGVDPTKAAAYASYADDRYVPRVRDTPDAMPVAYTEPTPPAFEAETSRY